MKSGRAATWAARSASSSSSHLAAISGSGSPRRLHCSPSPSPPPPPLAVPCFLSLSSSFLFLSFPVAGFFLSVAPFVASFSRRNLRRWKTRLDSEFIKMHAAGLRIWPEYLLSFTRACISVASRHRRSPTWNRRRSGNIRNGNEKEN